MTEEIQSEEPKLANKHLDDFDQIVQELKGLLETAKTEVAAIGEIREQVESDHKVVLSTVSLCKDVPPLSAAATQAKDGTEEKLAEVRACAEEASGLFTKLDELVSEAEESVADLKNHVQISEKADAKVEQLTAELQKLKNNCELQLGTIEGLLPGATSAGLASAFSDRSETFKLPEKRWHNWFIGSLVALIFLAGQGVYATASGSILSYDELVRLWLTRLPIAAALVWLALHSSREAALAKRVEEDYAYKAAIASSLEGFRKMLLDINSEARDQTVLGRLCSDTLATISAPPGRIYDRHKLTETPIDKIGDTVSAVSNAMPARLVGKAKEETDS